MFPGSVVAHNSGAIARYSGVIARYSGVILRGYLFCILLFQHTSVDPDFLTSPAFLQNSSLFKSFRRTFNKFLPSANIITERVSRYKI